MPPPKQPVTSTTTTTTTASSWMAAPPMFKDFHPHMPHIHMPLFHIPYYHSNIEEMLPDKKSHDRRARCAVLMSLLVVAIVATAALLPAIFMITDSENNEYNVDVQMRKEQITVIIRLQPVGGKEMGLLEKDSFERTCSEFFGTRLADVSTAEVELLSQSIVLMTDSEEGEEIYTNVVLVNVAVEKSPYARTYLESRDVVNVVRVDRALLMVMLKARSEPYFETIAQVDVTSTDQKHSEQDTSGVVTTPVRGPVNPMACNGHLNLCNMPVNEILFATMHNANSDIETASLDANQNHGILPALHAGLRGLNIDIGKCRVNGVKKISLVHSSCYLGFSDPFKVFTEIHQFLTDNPREVIIMPVQINDETGGRVRLAEIDVVFNQVIDSQGKSMRDRLYSHPRFDPQFPQRHPWPTLSELIEADTRIVFAHYNGLETCRENGCPPGFHDWFLYAAETMFGFATVDEIMEHPDKVCNITRGAHSFRDFFGINLFLDLPIVNASARMNEEYFVKGRLQTCSVVNGGLKPNLLAVDFWNTGDVLQVVDEYNAQLAPEEL